MLTERHKEIAGKIWEIANRLRGPYRPPQYRLVMLPMVVLRRFDSVLEPTKDAVIKEHARLVAAGTAERAIPNILKKIVDPNRSQPLYNTSPFTFAKLLDDSENIAPNLVSYINGFSDTAKAIFDKFKFGEQIEKLDASNRLFNIVKAMADPTVDLHPDRISNIEMGYIFEHLVMKFNEQANEEAGDHFTPREVIRLMTSLVYTGEQDVYEAGVYREIYDPACGTGGMLSVSEEFIVKGQNERANLGLYPPAYSRDEVQNPKTLRFTRDRAHLILKENRLTTRTEKTPLAQVLKAALFAAERHRNQRRKGTRGAPYINHPLAVAECLVTAGIDDPDVLAAALLHDTVEDTDTSLGELEQLFGPRVASIVAEVTDDKSLPKAERKRQQILKAPAKSREAKLVKLADKICNLRDLRDCPPNWTSDRITAYHRFARDVYRGLRGEHSALDGQIQYLLGQHVQPGDKICTFD